MKRKQTYKGFNMDYDSFSSFNFDTYKDMIDLGYKDKEIAKFLNVSESSLQKLKDDTTEEY